MRLLHVEDFTVKRFESGQQPPYAILSHRWGDSEARLADLQRQRETAPEVLAKVKGFAGYVKAHLPDIEWIWVDSCCIDLDSTAELSEGVNRMFSWYRSSRVCIAYLSYVKDPYDPDMFRKSVWFTRGWTLQEMVASTNMIFLTNKWQVIGHKGSVGHLRVQDRERSVRAFRRWSVERAHLLEIFSSGRPDGRRSLTSPLNWA